MSTGLCRKKRLDIMPFVEQLEHFFDTGIFKEDFFVPRYSYPGL